MAIFKIEKDRDYTVMSNHHLRDKDLSLKAKGLLSFMLSLPDDWDYSLNGLIAVCKEGREAIQNILDELKRCSYVKIELVRGQKGQFEYEYTIFEKPSKIPLKNRNSPNTGLPYTDEPFTGNPHQINTNKQIDILDKIDKWVLESKNDNLLEEKKETVKEEVSHNLLTKELIRLKYIESDDSFLLYYDKLFEELLKIEGTTYTNLLIKTSYIARRVINRNFKDEDSKNIDNKYCYFEKAIKLNIQREKNMPDELFSDESINEMLKEFEGNATNELYTEDDIKEILDEHEGR